MAINYTPTTYNPATMPNVNGPAPLHPNQFGKRVKQRYAGYKGNQPYTAKHAKTFNRSPNQNYKGPTQTRGANLKKNAPNSTASQVYQRYAGYGGMPPTPQGNAAQARKAVANYSGKKVANQSQQKLNKKQFKFGIKKSKFEGRNKEVLKAMVN